MRLKSIIVSAWNRTEMLGDGTSSDYSVSAVLAPGDWTGTVTFECLVQ